MKHEELRRIADLLAQRNRIDGGIAAVIQRPMTSGHLGEWIAAEIFDAEPEKSASAAAWTAISAPVHFKGVRST